MKRRNRCHDARLLRKRTEHNRARALKRELRQFVHQAALELLVKRRTDDSALKKAKSAKRKARQKLIRRLWVEEKPKALTLLEEWGYTATLSMVSRIRQALADGRRVILDLTDLQDFRAAAVLKLHAELSVLEALNGGPLKKLSIHWPKDARIANALSRLGFYNAPPSNKDLPGVLPIRTDVKGYDQIGILMRLMNRSIYDGQAKTDGEQWDGLHKALTEAILNVQMHAYATPDRKKLLKELGPRWWVMGETHGDQLHLAVFDKGIGIPRSLGQKSSDISRVLSRYMRAITRRMGGKDSGAIKAAMVFGRSRLNREGQGTGLTDIRSFVSRNPQGRLFIFSNHGKYTYDSNSGRETLVEHGRSMHGTLIQWNVSLKA